MNRKHFPERIRTACDRLRRSRGLSSGGKYLSPERLTWVIRSFPLMNYGGEPKKSELASVARQRATFWAIW